jgi:hypothetical protein
MSNVAYERLPVRVGGVGLSVAVPHRAGELGPILFAAGSISVSSRRSRRSGASSSPIEPLAR